MARARAIGNSSGGETLALPYLSTSLSGVLTACMQVERKTAMPSGEKNGAKGTWFVAKHPHPYACSKTNPKPYPIVAAYVKRDFGA